MALKLCADGGSQIILSNDARCCIPLCQSERQSNVTLPYYTFPRDPKLLRQWLDIVQFENEHEMDMSNIHETHLLCPKHFQVHSGGLSLFIDDCYRPPDHLAYGTVCDQIPKPSPNATKVTSSTQTFNDDWLKDLKQHAGIEIIYGTTIQCRVCGNTSVPAVSIFNKNNKILNLETLINTVLPITVSRSDMKPLNVCVQCVHKLKQYIEFFDCCLFHDQNFEKSLSVNKNENNSHDDISDSIHELPEVKPESIQQKKCPCDNMKRVSRKLKIKILVSAKSDCPEESIGERLPSIGNLIEVEYQANFIVCHGKEWIYDIIFDDNQLNYPQETVEHITKVINDTMRKRCEEKNSQMDSLPILPSHLPNDLVLSDEQQVGRESIIFSGEKHVMNYHEQQLNHQKIKNQ